jgi:phosphoglucomutase
VSSAASEPRERSGFGNVPAVVTAFYTNAPDPSVAAQRVAFGAAGHRGSAFARSFNDAHVLSIAQAVCDYRRRQGVSGPVFLGVDTDALSMLALATALEVLAANGVEVLVASSADSAPARAVSGAIRTYNRGRANALADGIVIAAPQELLEKVALEYILPHGGPPDAYAARWIDTAANEYLRWGPGSVRQVPCEQALASTRAAALPPSLYWYAALGSYIKTQPGAAAAARP